MNKNEKIIKIICKVLKLKKKDINLKLKIGDIKQWDSLAHLNIYVELTKSFQYKKVDMQKLSKVKSVKDWIKYFS
jgi:acyl carrier protein|tara:strand:- start:1410 stop:1634 length:225 start_codon:yes stop_codon:yes gene_type:complete